MLEVLPETVTLRAGRLKWAMVGLIGLVFTLAAVLLPNMELPMKLLTGGFFGLVTVLSVPGLFGWRTSLKLDRTGFTCETLFRTWRRAWTDCSMFTPIAIGMNTFVGFSTVSDETKHPGWAAASRFVSGTSGMLPENYGMPPAKLADLMNRFRERAFSQ